jgi:hypothetical protein
MRRGAGVPTEPLLRAAAIPKRFANEAPSRRRPKYFERR